MRTTRTRTWFARGSTAGGLVLGGLLTLGGATRLSVAGALLVAMGSAVVALMGGSDDVRWSRLYLVAMLGGAALMLAGATPGVFTVATVLLCLGVVLAGAWERSRTASVIWALTAIALYLVATAAEHRRASGALTPVIEQAMLIGVVPVGLAVLSAVTHTITRHLHDTVILSEIARQKLVRSNAVLGRSMQDTEDALAKLETIVDTLGEGLLAVSGQRVDLANPKLATLLDRQAIPTGASIDEALPAPFAERVHGWLRSGGSASTELPLAGDRVGHATVSPLASGAGAVVLLRDVTLSKRMDRMKSDFAATVSHEMRTPLTSVLGFTKLIGQKLEGFVFPAVSSPDPQVERAKARVRRNLGIVLEEGQRLTSLIDNVLDLSKLESGQMLWRTEAVPPAELVARATDATGPLFEGNPEVRMHLDIAPDLPAVEADRDRIQQVLVNLIGNAAKFTDAGTVTVGARLAGAHVALYVADTGVGIRPADQESIFDKFRQVGDVLTDRPRGTGLGLPICREIVTHHGGTLHVDSELGEGSVFTFTLPLATRAPERSET